jgi:hypothetical protein
MATSIKFKPIQLLIPLLLACFALLPSVQATPDPAAVPGNNTADGAGALANLSTGQFNTAFGTNALFSNTIGNQNAAQGNSALFSNVDGNQNVGVGNAALRFNTTGDQNTGVGVTALNLAMGGQNTALGFGAGRTITTGLNNIAIGWLAGETLTSGNNNIFIGSAAGSGSESDAIRIGTPAAGMGTCFIAGIRDINPAGTNEEIVVINASGQLGSFSLATLLAASSTTQELRSTVAKQEKEIKELTARLEEQAALIQKVSAQLELNKSAPKTVANE